MTAQQIINDVADHYGITTDQLIHGDKHRMFADPRHIAAYCLRVKFGLKYKVIGDMLGGKHHAAIIYAVRKVGSWMQFPQLNPDAVNYINQIK